MRIINQSVSPIDLPDPVVCTHNIVSAAKISHMSNTKSDYKKDLEFAYKLINWGHMSPFEHESISFEIITSRAIANELVRHRHCAFTQESTRYCDYTKGLMFIRPEWFNRVDDLTTPDTWESAMIEAETYYKLLMENKHIKAEDARGVLPLDLATTLVMTTNFREWISILKLRCDEASHPQMRELMKEIRQILINVYSFVRYALTTHLETK